MAASAAIELVMEPREQVLVIERAFQAPRELVWEAFTKPEPQGRFPALRSSERRRRLTWHSAHDAIRGISCCGSCRQSINLGGFGGRADARR
jgi:hypothetical protein